MAPARSSSLIVRVAGASAVPALGLDRVRLTTLSVATTLLSIIGTVNVAIVWLAPKVSVPVAVW